MTVHIVTSCHAFGWGLSFVTPVNRLVVVGGDGDSRNDWKNSFYRKNTRKRHTIIKNSANNEEKEDGIDTPYDYFLEYDMVIVGGGASGLFASSASTMLGAKTLLLDKIGPGKLCQQQPNNDDDGDDFGSNIGGDCTNAACVPSKAVRSVARMAATATAAAAAAAAQYQIDRNVGYDGIIPHDYVNDADSTSNTTSWLSIARNHATDTVRKVRMRESPQDMVTRNPNLDVGLVSTAYFVTPNEMILHVHEFYQSSSSSSSSPNATSLARKDVNITMRPTMRVVRIRSKKFVIATGAVPVVPERLQRSAKEAGLPIYTYRTLLRPSNEDKNSFIWQLLEDDPSLLHNGNSTSTKKSVRRVVVAGGGATACELGQALSRLGQLQPQRGTTNEVGKSLEIHIVAPELLAGEDITLQNAAYQLLSANDNVHFYLGQRLQDVLPNGTLVLSHNGSFISDVDALVLCLGRQPDLASLRLDNANVWWNSSHGVLVHPSTLQSVTARHVSACGDCSSAVAANPSTRTATHAGWTGYYAASNALLPRFLTLGTNRAVHSTVPRVIYTDPELVSVGMSLQECNRRFGVDGFSRVFVSEEGTDRADMESLERQTILSTVGFVEIRATKVDGRILGFTACGSGASELANEMSVVIENRLTAQNVANSLHSYPSFGYLLHRVALSIAFSSTWGLLEACGPVGGLLARPGRWMSKIVNNVKVTTKRDRSGLLDWQAEGSGKGLLLSSVRTVGHRATEERVTSKPNKTPASSPRIISFLDALSQEPALGSIFAQSKESPDGLFELHSDMNVKEFEDWVGRCPNHSKFRLEDHQTKRSNN